MSLGGGSNTLQAGHTAVVTSVKVNQQGNGVIGLMEENGIASGWNQLSVSNWNEAYGSPGSYYYYDQVSWLEIASGAPQPPSISSRFTVTPLGLSTDANGINDRGQVTGDVTQATRGGLSTQRPFLYSGRRITVLASPTGSNTSATGNE